jgi:hypothetical protein
LRRDAAVDHQHLAGDVTGVVGEQDYLIETAKLPAQN